MELMERPLSRFVAIDIWRLTSFKISGKVNVLLRDYQREGIRFLYQAFVQETGVSMEGSLKLMPSRLSLVTIWAWEKLSKLSASYLPFLNGRWRATKNNISLVIICRKFYSDRHNSLNYCPGHNSGELGARTCKVGRTWREAI